MKIGPIQRSILMFLYRNRETGAFIGSTTKASEFAGLDLEQVKNSLAKLTARNLIYKEGIRYLLKPAAKNWCWYEEYKKNNI